MNSILKGIVTGLVSLFLIAYVGYQAYLALYHSVKTERAYSSTVQDTIAADGFILYDETVITADIQGGVVDFARQDGERVAKDGVIANVYASASDVESQRRLQQLEKRIEALKEANEAGSIGVVDVNTLEAQIADALLNLAQDAQTGDLEDLYEKRDTLLGLLNQKQVATGLVKDFNSRIAELEAQAADLRKSIGGSLMTISSPVSGYFVSSVDGYEGCYDMSKILSISVSDIEGLKKIKPAAQSGAIAKIVSDYKWYVVCILPRQDAQKLAVGSTLGARFPLSSKAELPFRVAAVNQSGDRYAVVLECEQMTSQLAGMRKQTLNLIANEYTGIRVPNSEIHIVDGRKGVYVRDGNTAHFVKIVPVYSGNGYTLSEINTADSSRLQVYDEIIVNGDGMYDGKLIK